MRSASGALSVSRTPVSASAAFSAGVMCRRRARRVLPLRWWNIHHLVVKYQRNALQTSQPPRWDPESSDGHEIHGVGLELPIGGHDVESFHLGLRNEDAVEWISMVSGKKCDLERMLVRDREQRRRRLGHAASQIGDGFVGKSQLPRRVLDNDFPQGRS